MWPHRLGSAVILIMAWFGSAHAEWPNAGMPLGNREIAIPDERGGMFSVGWVATGSSIYDLVAEHVNVGGISSGPKTICVSDTSIYYLQVVPDLTGGMFCVRTNLMDVAGNPEYALRLQRADASGEPLWGPSGIVVTQGQDLGGSPTPVVPDGVGGAYVFWFQYPLLIGQHFDSNGVPFWDHDLMVVEYSATGVSLLAVPDGLGSAIVLYGQLANDPVCGTLREILLVRTVEPFNGTPGYPTTVVNAKPIRTGLTLAPDGAGGAVVGWFDARDQYCFWPANDVYVQRLRRASMYNGQLFPMWEYNGVKVSGFAAADDPMPSTLSVVPDDNGGAYVVWGRSRIGYSRTLAQHVGPSGNKLWPEPGLDVTPRPDSTATVLGGRDGAGGLLLAHGDRRCDPATGDRSFEVRARRILPNGSPAWSVPLVPGWSSPSYAGWVQPTAKTIFADGRGGSIVQWALDSNGARPNCLPANSLQRVGIMAQRVDSSGAARALVDVVAGAQLTERILTIWPTPAHGPISLEYRTPQAEAVTVDVVDVAGHRISILADRKPLPAGTSRMSWTGHTASGEPVRPGIYFIRARGSLGALTTRVVIVR